MKINMPFKPKAQILLQLGEQLIKSESIAILELVKNSYDADATLVSISMTDVESADIGVIEIVDNGTGMSLDTVTNIWMEPGNTHKKSAVMSSSRTKMGRLPIGEKGIGRFGVHKLGKKIEMITRAKDSREVCVRIDWEVFNTAKYLNDVEIEIEEREPIYFLDEETGTKLKISSLSCDWTRGMLRDVYRAVNSLGSPFNSLNAFKVKFKTTRLDWLDGLLSFEDIKQYALYKGHIVLNGGYISKMEYEFTPYDNMDIKPRKKVIDSPIKIAFPKKKDSLEDINLDNFRIGEVIVDLLVFDRDSNFRNRFIADKKTYGSYLDENGGIRVFRDGIRIYNYGEQGNDWLELDIKRVNAPGKYLSNNLVLGAVHLDREGSEDLKEKANREGFIENAAYSTFKKAVYFAIEMFTAQRNIDKENLRLYLAGGPKEPITHEISEIRKKIQVCISDEKDRKIVDNYLKQVETDYELLKQMYLKTANAGMSYGVVIHEIEKVISELNIAVKVENTSAQIKNLAKHLSKLIESYAELLKNRSKSMCFLNDIINQAIFSIQYRMEAHQIELCRVKTAFDDAKINCSSNLIVGSIINIIDNSIWWTTYSEVKKKKIFIKTTNEIDGKVAIVIADNGCGFSISSEDAIKPFVSTKPHGMGLGLNIVNEIMLSQGASLLFPEQGDIELPDEFKNGAVLALVFKEDLR